MEAQRARRSIGRWCILLLIGLMYLITYLDRVNISTAAPVISKEFGFDKVTMGAIFSACGWAYAIFQVPGGWLGDRFGARNVLTIIVGYWSIMTAVTVAATGAVSLAIIRFLFGIGEAGAFPVATRAMQLWYPRQERGFVQGVTHSASRLGAAVAPPIVVLIMTTFGWRAVFWVCGAVGLVWSVLWYLAYRNLPEEHGVPSYDELVYVTRDALRNDPRLPRFLTALKQATAFIAAHPDKALSMFLKKYPDLDDALNRRAFAATVPRFAKDPGALDAARYQAFAEFMKAKGLIAAVPPLDSYAVQLKAVSASK